MRVRDVGTGHPDRAPPHRSHRALLLGGVQPGRQDPGQRQRGSHGAAVERDHRPPDRRTRSPVTPDRSSSVAFSPDGKTLASGSDDGTVRLWNVATGRQIGSPLTGHTDAVNSVAFSPNGKTLASISQDGYGAAMGRGRPAARSATPSLARTTAGQRRWRSARTAGPWLSPETRSGCGMWPTWPIRGISLRLCRTITYPCGVGTMGKTWPGVREHLPLNHRRTRSKPGEPTAPDRVAADLATAIARASVRSARNRVANARRSPKPATYRQLKIPTTADCKTAASTSQTTATPPVNRTFRDRGMSALRSGMSDMGAVRDAYTLTVLERRFGDLFNVAQICT